MLANQLAETIKAAPPSQLDTIAQTLWKAHAAGALSDIEAQCLAELIEARRPARRPAQGGPGQPFGAGGRRPPSLFPPRRPQFARKHPERIGRRRRLVAAGPLPPQLAELFTPGETAVLAIVGSEIRAQGFCDRSIGEVAARAGVCRSLAQAALRQAARMKLITIELRQRVGQKNDTNIVRITAQDWLAWIERGPRRTVETGSKKIGSKKIAPTDTVLDSRAENRARGHAILSFGRKERQVSAFPRGP